MSRWLLAAALATCPTRAKTNDVLVVAAEPAQLEAVAWLAGSWVGTVDGARVEEHWTPPAGGTMVGLARTVLGGRTLFFEYLRIEVRDGRIVYLASPLGRDPPTQFELVGQAEQAVTFENPEHDYPQRISYRREGDHLRAHIEGTENQKEKSSDWIYERARIE